MESTRTSLVAASDSCEGLPLVTAQLSKLRVASGAYPTAYDDVLRAVTHRLQEGGHATKLDLAALVAWKRVQTAKWMKTLWLLPETEVVAATMRAFEEELTDEQRLDALEPLPGFGSRGAFASVLFTAWRPDRYGVFDRNARSALAYLTQHRCRCHVERLPVYWAHLRRVADQEDGLSPRGVDVGLYQLGADA